MRALFVLLAVLGSLTPRVAAALSIDWSCVIGGAYTADKSSHLEPSPANSHLIGSSFIVDYGSGLVFGKTLPAVERLRSTILISQAYKEGDYVVVYRGAKPAFLYIQASSDEKQKPFTLFEGSSGTTFVGTCNFGAANNSFKPNPLRGSA